jgi:uncharacterized protein (DUF488 family)
VKNHARSTGIILTIGHSTRTVEDFIHLLKENNVAQIIDIRTVPRSRHNPQFNSNTLPDTLSKAGISYQHIAGLGGLRRARPNSPNLGWRNASFRGFADYMQTPEFEQNLQILIGLAQKEVIALMCAEAVPWRCHRSLIADALMIRGVTVEHILSRANRRTHVLTSWARITGDDIIYPPPDVFNKE